jgi:hypothetical protein
VRIPADSILLDCQGLSLLLRRDRGMGAMMERARSRDVPVFASILTVMEAAHGRIDRAHLNYVLSRLYSVEEVTREDGMMGLNLMRSAGVAGHSHAIDAACAALALRLPGRPAVYTSDPDDWWLLLGDRALIVPL